MWVHPDIIESQLWITVTHRKSKGKVEASSSNVVDIFSKKTEEDIAFLTSLGEKESVLAADTILLPRRRLIRQAVLETIWSTSDKLFPTSEGDNRAIYKAVCGQIEGALLCQSPSKI